uniref:galactosylceramidase n=1 Tax=Arion vulgaris TaxID=1028688 RepID=A0A0B7AM96_9EUPU
MMKSLLLVAVPAICCLMLTPVTADNNNIVFDDTTGLGRTFDGIGGISGGGATSKLLVNYPKLYRDEILDFLFLPNFGASLQILKVEIGGDIQSTDGTEASHMHNSWEENYERGYEWWLMVEAKKRNPDIKLYALPWGFPGWIGQGTSSPYTNNNVTADYVVRWINGAKTYYNLTIDYVGIWNERLYNVDYIKTLRSVLDQRGFQNVLIIASDDGWQIAGDISKDPELAKDVHAIGCHYPGTWSSNEAYLTGNKLWASEDYSTFNDEVGSGCWARILNQNYVNGYMTATISWNLIASYYAGLPYYRDGLMTALQPWSGNYVVQSTIWVSAHTTQFTSIGWKYLNHTSGVGKLPSGGSYVGLVSPDNSDLTIIIETLTHDHSICIRPPLPAYSVTPQNVTITLNGHLAGISQLYVWYSKLNYNGDASSMFNSLSPLKVVNNSVQLSLGLDEVYTLTTLPGGLKGSYPAPPPAGQFPLPYSENFEGYQLHEEPYNLAQQTGSFEVHKSGSNKFLRQMVLNAPLAWCEAEKLKKAVNVIGNITWTDLFVEVDFELPSVNASTGVFVAVRINQGGCELMNTWGIYLFATSDYKYILANDPFQNTVLTSGNLPAGGGWHKLSLFVQGQKAYGAYDGTGIFSVNIPSTPPAGFAGIGTQSFGLADFDNLYLAAQQEGMAKMTKYFSNPMPESQPLYFIKEHN